VEPMCAKRLAPDHSRSPLGWFPGTAVATILWRGGSDGNPKRRNGEAHDGESSSPTGTGRCYELRHRDWLRGGTGVIIAGALLLFA